MKKVFYLFVLVALFYPQQIFSTTASPGFTGLIDLPSAYVLRTNNYNITGIIDKVSEDTSVGLMLETGLVPQLEAGLKITTNETEINKNFLKANIKYQFIKEMKNPAMAVGFVESNEGLAMEGENVLGQAYAYLVASKRIANFYNKEGIPLTLNLGLTYDELDNLNGFGGLEIPLYTNINLLCELYSYNELENNDDDTKLSVNVGGEFYTTEKIITKVFWRERNETFGLSVSYIGIYK